MITATGEITLAQIERVVNAVLERAQDNRWARIFSACRMCKVATRVVVHANRDSEMRVQYQFAGIVWTLDFVRVNRVGWRTPNRNKVLTGKLSEDLESLYLDALERLP